MPQSDDCSIRFDWKEVSGAFSDLGADLPLLIGMILSAGLDSASVLITYGLMQVCTGWFCRLPMPVQPLKLVAILVITQKIDRQVIFGAGLSLGLAMLLLAKTGVVNWAAKVVPKSVVRGMQFGLGLQLAALAFSNYVGSASILGYWLASLTFVLVLMTLGHPRFPSALLVVLLGTIYTLAFKVDFTSVVGGFGLHLPQWHVPRLTDIRTGFLTLAIVQLPLSLANSVLATAQKAGELPSSCNLDAGKLARLYALMNLVNPFLSGVPTSHASSALANHYDSGARTGGSVIICGVLYLACGAFFGKGFKILAQEVPLPILGVLLAFEGLNLLLLVRDVAVDKKALAVAFLVALMANGLPYGYAIGLCAGTAIHHWLERLAPRTFAEP